MTGTARRPGSGHRTLRMAGIELAALASPGATLPPAVEG